MCEISVIVPVYNVEKYLQKCIESIIHQTFKDLEIILVNDGSTDRSLEILREYEKRDSRITVIDKANGGVSEARNIGIDIAKGKYLYFADSDDYMHSQLLEIMHEQIVKHGCDMTICDMCYVREGEKTKEENEILDVKREEIDSAIYVQTMEEAFSLMFRDKHIEFIIPINKLYSADLFREIRYPVGRIHEDEYTTYKLIYQSKKIVYITIPLYYYVRRRNSITTSAFSEKRFDRVLAFGERADFCIAHNMNVVQAVKWYLRYYEDFIKQFKKQFPGESEKLKEYKKTFREARKNYIGYLPLAERIKLFVLQKMPGLYRLIYRITRKKSMRQLRVTVD